MEDYKKAAAVLTLTAGMLIFAVIVLWNVDTMSKTNKAELRLLSTSLDWNDYLYSQAAKKIAEDKN